MTAPDNRTSDPSDGIQTEEFQDEGPRQHMKDVEAENKNLRARELGRAITDIGLDAKVGLGLAIAEAYKGDFSDGDVAAFAKEKYTHEPVEGEPVAPAAETLETKEAVVATVTESSTPVTPVTQVSEIEELDNALADPEVDGPAVSAIAIEKKLQSYIAGEYRGNPNP
jgi:hypothetical protein